MLQSACHRDMSTAPIGAISAMANAPKPMNRSARISTVPRISSRRREGPALAHRSGGEVKLWLLHNVPVRFYAQKKPERELSTDNPHSFGGRSAERQCKTRSHRMDQSKDGATGSDREYQTIAARRRRPLPPISPDSNRSEDQNLRSGKSDKNQEHAIKQLSGKGPGWRAHDDERGQNNQMNAGIQGDAVHFEAVRPYHNTGARQPIGPEKDPSRRRTGRKQSKRGRSPE